MSRNKMKDRAEPIDELTEEMHATFTISEEHDREYRVWSCIRAQKQTGWPIEELLENAGVTMADFEKYKNTQPGCSG